MLKHKITSIIMGALMLSGIIAGGSVINNVKIPNDNTKAVNKVLLAAPSNTNERAVVVNTDNSPLVLYSSANSNSSITSYISVGEMLTIQSSGNNFYKVKVQETGATGYISAHNLQIITSGVNDTYNSINKQGYIINVSSKVNLRANATMSSNVLTKLTNNTKINVLGKQGQWYKVNCNGTIGYIYQDYIGLTDTPITNATNKIIGLNTNKNISSDTNIKSENGQVGYTGQSEIYSKNLNSITSAENRVKQIIKEGMFNERSETTVSKSTNLYSSPSLNSNTILELSRGTKLMFIYNNKIPKGWSLVATSNGTIGYVNSNDITILMGGSTVI